MNPHRFTGLLVAGVLATLLGWIVPPLAMSAEGDLDFFETKVRPLLSKQCYECHGQTRVKGGLRLDAKTFILDGGDSGPAAVPGKPQESLLIKVLSKPPKGISRMPDDKEALSNEQIGILTDWVRRGLPWPDEPPPTDPAAAAKTHWSFQKVTNPKPPANEGRTPIDKFVRAKLKPAGLSPTPRADRRTLLRRLSYTLTGLPPSFKELEAFANDKRPHAQAWAAQVDRMLASPHYGERWARHWLDLARYADTKGYLVAGANREYPYAYTYRDWVVSALNEDLPYDQFLTLQIAADRVPEPRTLRHEGKSGGDYKPDLAALGFLTVGRRFLNRKEDIYDDRIDVITRSALGLTVACARCHDHPFDPVSQMDYYALFGVFDSSTEPDSLPTIGPLADDEATRKFSAELEKRAKKVHDFLASKIPDYKQSKDIIDFQESIYRRKLGRSDREKMEKLIKTVRTFEASSAQAQPRAMVLNDKPRPVNSPFLHRGSPSQRGGKVQRRFISLLDPEQTPYPGDSSGRFELAQNLTAKDNPLTARVMVNRVWAHHFGRALVDTPSDFGLRSNQPSHPQLLDHLATRFMAQGWSLKKLHRQILLSDTWQQGSDLPKDGAAAASKADPENRLLSRQNRRRLDFEAMRDSLLAASGELDRRLGGKPEKMTKAPFSKRRSVYGYVERQNLPQLFRTFDFASPDVHVPERAQTTTPMQALYLMNSPFLLAQAQAVAKRAKSTKGDQRARARQLSCWILAREPTDIELREFVAYLKSDKAGNVSPEDQRARATWQYGSGKLGDDGKTTFTPLPYFGERRYSGSAAMPDPKLDWAMLGPTGGHPGSKVAVIRRWTAPADLHVNISGRVLVDDKKSDGVRAVAVCSRHGIFEDKVATPGKAVPFDVGERYVRAGEHIDFVTTKHKGLSFDSFHWSPVITAKEGGRWDADKHFAPPDPPGTARLAQILLCSNEFLFID